MPSGYDATPGKRIPARVIRDLSRTTDLNKPALDGAVRFRSQGGTGIIYPEDDYEFGRITSITGTGNAARYGWEILWIDGNTGNVTTDPGFVSGNATSLPGVNIAYPQTATDLTVGAPVLIRPASGTSGALTEIVPLGGGSSAILSGSNYTSFSLDLTANDTWMDSGLTLDLPSAGNYSISYSGTAQAQLANDVAGNFNVAYIGMRVVDSGNVAVSPGRYFITSLVTSGICSEESGSGTCIYTASGAITIKLQGIRTTNNSSAPGWSKSVLFVGGSSNGAPGGLTYVKLS